MIKYMLNPGEKAPDFAAPDQRGHVHKLSDYRGEWVLLYFYPKDDTPGCTKEACTLRDRYADFEKIRAVVLGVSTDTVASHEKFAAKYALPFTILSDSEKKIVKDYGADGLAKRISYLVDPAGRIAQAYPKVKPEEHAAQVLEDLVALRA